MRPSITRANGHWTHGIAASKHTTAPLKHTRPSSRKHSPDVTTSSEMAEPDHCLLLIYRPRKDERLSWPSWLTCSGWFTRISGHPSATGRAKDSKSPPAKGRRSITVLYATMCPLQSNIASTFLVDAKELRGFCDMINRNNRSRLGSRNQPRVFCDTIATWEIHLSRPPPVLMICVSIVGRRQMPVPGD